MKSFQKLSLNLEESRDTYIWSSQNVHKAVVISKNILNIFLALILRKLQIDRLIWRVTVKKRRRQFMKWIEQIYVLLEISKNIFNIFLAQVIRKLDVFRKRRF